MDVQLRIEGDNIVCDWGVFTNPDCDPAKPISPLIVIAATELRELLTNGPKMDRYGNLGSARDLDTGLFFTCQRGAQSWTWKVFPCHWWDDPRPGGRDPHIFVGRWMD